MQFNIIFKTIFEYIHKKFRFIHTNTFCKYRKKLLASPRVHLVLYCFNGTYDTFLFKILLVTDTPYKSVLSTYSIGLPINLTVFCSCKLALLKDIHLVFSIFLFYFLEKTTYCCRPPVRLSVCVNHFFSR